MLADPAEEVDCAHRRGPVEVVDHARGVVALEAQEAFDLRAEVTDPFLDGFDGVERAFGITPARVANQAGRTPDEAERFVAGQLEATEHQNLHEVAEVQARRCRVEPAVVGDGVASEERFERHRIGRHVHKPAIDELLPDVLERRAVGNGCSGDR